MLTWAGWTGPASTWIDPIPAVIVERVQWRMKQRDAKAPTTQVYPRHRELLTIFVISDTVPKY
jgi:hypothetical protein